MIASNESFIIMEDEDLYGMSSFRINKFAPITPIVNPTREEVLYEENDAKAEAIQALIARTDSALSRIVTIRKSMESSVDFKQFQSHRKMEITSQSKQTLFRQNSNSSQASTIGSCDTHDTVMLSSGDSLLLGDSKSQMDDLQLLAQRFLDKKESSYSSISIFKSKESTHSLVPSSCASTEFTESGSIDTIGRELSASDDSMYASIHTSTGDDELLGSYTGEAQMIGRNEAMDSMHYDEDRFSCFSSLSLCDEEANMSLHKQRRLERLRNIEIMYIEGYPKDFYATMARFLHATIETKRRYVRLSFIKDTFTGYDCIVRIFGDGFADNQVIAFQFGQTLMRQGYIEHVDHKIKELRNSHEDFYRFSRRYQRRVSESKQSRETINAAHYRECVIAQELMICDDYDFDQASDHVHTLVTDECLRILARLLRRLFKQRNKLLLYKGLNYCFLGAEAVNVLRHTEIATSTLDAILIGQALFDEGIIESVAKHVTTFQDKYIFYRFTTDAT